MDQTTDIATAYIRLHGENAKEHPVFKELSRVRLYFEKLKNAESGGSSKRDGLALDKEAAGRIIKHGLVRCIRQEFGPHVDREIGRK